jgi:hypothetical protein
MGLSAHKFVWDISLLVSDFLEMYHCPKSMYIMMYNERQCSIAVYPLLIGTVSNRFLYAINERDVKSQGMHLKTLHIPNWVEYILFCSLFTKNPIMEIFVTNGGSMCG